MKKMLFPFLMLLLSASFLGCNNTNTSGHTSDTSDSVITKSAVYPLATARKEFFTKLTKQNKMNVKPAQPPKNMFSIVYYPTNIGNMVAYLGKIPADNKLHPAIIWISGGFGNDISNVWEDADADNDQTAAAFRKAGIIMMYPAQRGGNGNPGHDESCYGEIDDILAAADYLARQEGIDPKRIYLGGHSTGGTKVLLAAECSNVFRAVFSFGPVASVNNYGPDYLTYNTDNDTEARLRTPALWFGSLKTPTYVIEGDEGNLPSLKIMRDLKGAGNNKFLHFHTVTGKDHFSVLQPVCKVIAGKILTDTLKGTAAIDLTADIKAIH
jgi:dipeptidyl aminopeptidase/acylaminoacyl peptidase/predicted small secreted protein